MPEVLLEISGLRKSFGGINALVSLDLSVFQGEICGIMGPNGSGKTVLFDLISGYLRPDAGSIYFGQERLDLTHLPPSARHALGITRTYQYLKLFQSLTGLENTMVGIGPQATLRSLWEVFSLKLRRSSENYLSSEASKALATFSKRLLPMAQFPASAFSYANRRRLEFARALAGKPRLIMLDEPTAGMNPHETYELQRIIYRLRKQGLTFLMIEHKMFFFEDLVDRVVVLAEGKKIAEGPVERIREDPGVKSAYLGESNAT